jgi:hypothetical protein
MILLVRGTYLTVLMRRKGLLSMRRKVYFSLLKAEVIIAIF